MQTVARYLLHTECAVAQIPLLPMGLRLASM
jgi:hypothetical protein